MYWKSAKLILLNNFSLRSTFRSITFRLTVIYMLTTFGLLAFATLFLYWMFVNRLQLENEQFLQNRILILQQILHSQPNEIKTSASYKEELLLEPPLDRYFSRIVDEHGKIILETPGMSDVAPLAVFVEIAPSGKMTFKAPRQRHSKNHHKRYYLLMSAPEDPSLPINKNQRIIQMAKDITEEHKIIEDSQESLIVILFLGMIVSAFVSIVVTRRSLKPLREITNSIHRITVTQLKERLNPASWPSELSVLAIAFNHMLDRIEEGFTRLSQFSADLAHELRTPINNLMGEAEIALSRSRTNEEYRETLESSLEEFQRLSHMIENLLFLARAENPRQTIAKSCVDIDQLFKDICDFYEAAAEEKQVTMYCQGEGKVEADPTLLRRAIVNLVSNALQHTFAGGSITLSVENNVDQSVKIRISDTGKGIAPEHLPYLFDRLYRVDADRSQHTGGTGLGLAIVKSIMDIHRGTVTISSELNQGTTVSLVFPGQLG